MYICDNLIYIGLFLDSLAFCINGNLIYKKEEFILLVVLLKSCHELIVEIGTRANIFRFRHPGNL